MWVSELPPDQPEENQVLQSSSSTLLVEGEKEGLRGFPLPARVRTGWRSHHYQGLCSSKEEKTAQIFSLTEAEEEPIGVVITISEQEEGL